MAEKLCEMAGNSGGNNKYTLIGTLANRTGSLAIPSNANEIFLVCYYTSAPTVTFTFYTAVNVLSSKRSFRAGYYNSSNVNAFIDVVASMTDGITFVGTNQAVLNSASANVTVEAYWR